MNRAFELLLAELEDDAGLTDAGVEAELKAAGVDLRSARTKLDATLLQVENANRRQRLDRARRERLSSGSRDRLADVRAHAYPLTELHAQIARRSAVVAHRELEGRSREDLESLLADLLALDEPE